MNIAIVGGERTCSAFIERVKRHEFKDLKPKVVAVSNVAPDSLCMKIAREEGISVTADYHELLDRDDIDLIIELTGDQQIFYDILDKKKRTIRAFDHKTASLFWELIRIADIQEQTSVKLAKTRSLYDLFLNELMEEDVMVIGPDYKIIEVNKTMANKLGLRRSDMVGRYCYEISHHRSTPCGGEEHPCPLIQSLKTGKSNRTTHIHRDNENREIYYAISCYPIYENGQFVAAVEISRDITRDMRIQKMAMQQDKLASIGRLAAGVAHEINNPMTTILTTAMLMQEDMDPEDPTYGDLRTIVMETLRCRKIVTSLLNFARQTKVTKKEIDMNHLVLECVGLTRKQAAFKDVVIESHIPEDLPKVFADGDQIQQALINLILNGIEATEPGGKITLTLQRSQTEGFIEIIVSDNGKGIPEENLDRIFEPFFTTKETGTGLGMAITHGLIEQHGGTIKVVSKVGQGTTFTITLPVHGDPVHA